MASNKTVLVENARLRMFQFLCLCIAISTILKQHFQLVVSFEAIEIRVKGKIST